MKNAKLIIDGKEIEVQVSEEDFEELTTTKKITGYERVNGERYYYNSGHLIEYVIDTGDVKSDTLYDIANYYSNVNIANNNARADKLMKQLRRFAVEHREKDIDWTISCKHYIYYDYELNKIEISDMICCRDFGQIYFDTEETAKLAAETFKDELLWYFTEYYDSL